MKQIPLLVLIYLLILNFSCNEVQNNNKTTEDNQKEETLPYYKLPNSMIHHYAWFETSFKGELSNDGKGYNNPIMHSFIFGEKYSFTELPTSKNTPVLVGNLHFIKTKVDSSLLKTYTDIYYVQRKEVGDTIKVHITEDNGGLTITEYRGTLISTYTNSLEEIQTKVQFQKFRSGEVDEINIPFAKQR